MHGSRGLSLVAGLIVISWTAVDAAPPTPRGVWWDQSWCPDLRTKDDAPRVWSTVTANHVMRGKPPEPGTDVKENPEAMTLAQWAASDWEPYSTYDGVVDIWFQRSAMLATIVPMLREGAASSLDVKDFTELAPALLNDGMKRLKQRLPPPDPAAGRPSHCSAFTMGGFDHTMWLVATGDVNGDGWQDWLVAHHARIQGGRITADEWIVITKRGDGPVIDITNQLPDPKTGPSGLAAWQAAKVAQPAWPEGKPRAFAGSITVNGKRLGITMTLTCSNTLLSGSYRYDHVGKDIPVAGSVGADGSLSLHEFPGPGVGTAHFVLTRNDAGAWNGTWDNNLRGYWDDTTKGTVTLAPKR